ncbi:hypothetical protein SPH9361_04322 [Sphingobium sp. CECT 9361]|nr:hypothetical protein SPH9361_04322 [Sphingobium sp. CECT 9361]
MPPLPASTHHNGTSLICGMGHLYFALTALTEICSGKLEKSYFLQSRDVPLAFSRGYA